MSVIRGLEETECHTFLEEAYSNLGWNVKNLHATEPRHEEGADLRLEREGSVVLVAVKKRPVTSDIPQLKKLAMRKDCDDRLYYYMRAPTEPFRKAAVEFSALVRLLCPEELHRILTRGESVEYLSRVFQSHPLVDDMVQAMGTLWAYRKTEFESVSPTKRERRVVWELKDATLKLRAGLTLASFRWDRELMNRLVIDLDEFETLLERALTDLDLVRRFVGGGLVSAFQIAGEEMPHLLGLFWKLIRERTFWAEYTVLTERLKTVSEVKEVSRSYWIVPQKLGGSRQQMHRESMEGFYSSLVYVFRTLATVGDDLESAVDWVYQERYE